MAYLNALNALNALDKKTRNDIVMRACGLSHLSFSNLS